MCLIQVLCTKLVQQKTPCIVNNFYESKCKYTRSDLRVVSSLFDHDKLNRKRNIKTLKENIFFLFDRI